MIIARTRLSVTLCVHCLSCSYSYPPVHGERTTAPKLMVQLFVKKEHDTKRENTVKKIALRDFSYLSLCQHNRNTRTHYIQRVLALVTMWNVLHREQCRFRCILLHLLFPLIHYIPFAIVLSRLQYRISVFTCVSAARDQWTERCINRSSHSNSKLSGSLVFPRTRPELYPESKQDNNNNESQ